MEMDKDIGQYWTEKLGKFPMLISWRTAKCNKLAPHLRFFAKDATWFYKANCTCLFSLKPVVLNLKNFGLLLKEDLSIDTTFDPRQFS
jgi:hypothetical protein